MKYRDTLFLFFNVIKFNPYLLTIIIKGCIKMTKLPIKIRIYYFSFCWLPICMIINI